MGWRGDPGFARLAGLMPRVLFVASELYPLVKTGGLADVAGALTPALRRQDIDVRLLTPGYPAVLAALGNGGRRAAAAGITFLPRGPRGTLPRRTACRSMRSTRRRCTAGPATPISAPTGATGRTTPCGSPPSPAPRRPSRA